MARTVLLTSRLDGTAKIVQLSGVARRHRCLGSAPNAASKAGVVRFAETLAEEVREYGIDSTRLRRERSTRACSRRCSRRVPNASGMTSIDEASNSRRTAVHRSTKAPTSPFSSGPLRAMGSPASSSVPSGIPGAHPDASRRSQADRRVYASSIVPSDRSLDW